MHGAGTAERHSTTELRAGHPDDIAQHPKEWCVAVDINVMCGPVDLDCVGHGVLSFCTNACLRGDTNMEVCTPASICFSGPKDVFVPGLIAGTFVSRCAAAGAIIPS